jgi:hypothetical protein
MRILEQGMRGGAKEAELKWLKRYLKKTRLKNLMITAGGAFVSSPATLRKLRRATRQLWKDMQYRAKQNAALLAAVRAPEYRKRRSKMSKAMWRNPRYAAKMRPYIVAAGKRPRSKKYRQYMSETLKARGKPKWSKAGEKRVRATQFQKGRKNTPEESRKQSAALRRRWKKVPKAKRSQMLTELNLKVWRKRSKSKRCQIGRNISKALRALPERTKKRIGRVGYKAALKKDPNFHKKARAGVKAFWASMTPSARSALMLKRMAKAVRKRHERKTKREVPKPT